MSGHRDCGKVTYVVKLTLFPLVCLEYLEELLVHVWVVGIAGLDLVEVLDCMIELSGGSVLHFAVQCT